MITIFLCMTRVAIKLPAGLLNNTEARWIALPCPSFGVIYQCGVGLVFVDGFGFAAMADSATKFLWMWWANGRYAIVAGDATFHWTVSVTRDFHPRVIGQSRGDLDFFNVRFLGPPEMRRFMIAGIVRFCLEKFLLPESPIFFLSIGRADPHQGNQKNCQSLFKSEHNIFGSESEVKKSTGSSKQIRRANRTPRKRCPNNLPIHWDELGYRPGPFLLPLFR